MIIPQYRYISFGMVLYRGSSRHFSFLPLQSVIERVDPFKNGSCVSDDNNRVQNIYTKKFNVSYSRQVRTQLYRLNLSAKIPDREQT